MKKQNKSHQIGLVAEFMCENGEIVVHGHINNIAKVIPNPNIDYPEEWELAEFDDAKLEFRHLWAHHIPTWYGEGHYQIYTEKRPYAFPITVIEEKFEEEVVRKPIPLTECCLYCDQGDEVEGDQIWCKLDHINYSIQHSCKERFKPNRFYLLAKARDKLQTEAMEDEKKEGESD